MPHILAGEPNLKALRRIMAALFVAAALCFAICTTLIVRIKPPHPTATTPARCICGGQGLRRK